MVAPPSSDGPIPVAEPAATSAESIYLKQDGKVYLVQGWQTLAQWIEESRIGPEDLISEGGVRWEHVNERTEVAHLFVAEPPEVAPANPGALPFDASPDSEPQVSEDAPMRQESRFGGVPTGLPPLPVLSAADLGATASEAARSPETMLGEETIDDSQDEFDVFIDSDDMDFEEAMDDDDLGDQNLTEELVFDPMPNHELRSQEPETASGEESVEDPPSDVSTLEDDELFAEFDSKKTAEPAPYSGDEWAEPDPSSPWPWVVAALVTLVAIAMAGSWVLSNNGVGTDDDLGLSTALTTALEPTMEPTPAPLVDTDSDRDVDSSSPDSDSDADSGADTDAPDSGTETPVVDVEPTPAPVASAPVAPIPSPEAPRPAVRSVSTMIDAGWSKVDRGSLVGAASEFQAALAARPGSGEANLGYGYVLVEQGRSAQAVRYLCTARDNASGSTSAEARGILSRLELSCD